MAFIRKICLLNIVYLDKSSYYYYCNIISTKL